MAAGKVGIVILNWNGWQDTIECLRSVFGITYPSYSVTVVDNGSTDGSVARIREWAGTNSKAVELVELPANAGYAAGNNAGIREVLFDPSVEYILVLNNDTTVSPDFLEKMTDVFAMYPQCGLVGPTILNYSTGEYVQAHWARRMTWTDVLMFNTPLKVIFLREPFINRHILKGSKPAEFYTVSGCCLLFRREALQAIKLFDEGTFLGWEECVVSEKLLAAGYKVYVAPAASIHHKIGASTAKLPSAEKTLAFLKSERFVIKNFLRFPRGQMAALSFLESVIYSAYALLDPGLRASYGEMMKVIRDI